MPGIDPPEAGCATLSPVTSSWPTSGAPHPCRASDFLSGTMRGTTHDPAPIAQPEGVRVLRPRGERDALTGTISGLDWGELAEIFLTNHRQGSDADAAACDSAVLASLLMQHGVSVDQIRRSLMRDSRGQPRTPLGIVLDRIAAEVKP